MATRTDTHQGTSQIRCTTCRRSGWITYTATTITSDWANTTTSKENPMSDPKPTSPDTTDEMTAEEAEELFRAMGVEIRDDITIH